MTSRRLFILSLIGFVVLAGLVLTLSPHRMRSVQAGFLGIISPLLKTGSSFEKQYRDFREGLKTLEQLEEQNKRLTISNNDLSATNQTLRGLEAENNQLRKALGYAQRATFQLVPARIIARDAASWYNNVVIDRGGAEGIKPDMAVLTEEGLVGKTTIVSEHSTVVVLISDETCRVAARVEKNLDRPAEQPSGAKVPEKPAEQGIIRGERSSTNAVPQISLNFLSKQAGLEPGQKIFTSGLGGVFPPGVLVGAVREFKVRELDGYATIVPAVDLTTLEDVFVVVSNRR
ncbi:MAG TPA: rod shape-determining protein MreC [Chthoniobacteraceae bacterium]|nr:rod shape-determining protein MreC [Chthoniobacteraceae bacterium]